VAKWVNRLVPPVLAALYVVMAVMRYGWAEGGAVITMSLLSLALIWFPWDMARLLHGIRWNWLFGEWELPAWLPPAIGWFWFAVIGVLFLLD